jgi:hypothetical protein
MRRERYDLDATHLQFFSKDEDRRLADVFTYSYGVGQSYDLTSMITFS